MATKAAPSVEKTFDADLPKEREYDGWKRDKVERAMAQTQDRAKMIPADKVWRDLGLEG